MQSMPPCSAALYLHYLQWDLSGECMPACLNLVMLLKGFLFLFFFKMGFHASHLHFISVFYVSCCTVCEKQRGSRSFNLSVQHCFMKSYVLSMPASSIFGYKQIQWISCLRACLCFHAPACVLADIFSIFSKLIDFN